MLTTSQSANQNEWTARKCGRLMKADARSETRSYQRASAASFSWTYSNGPSALRQSGLAQKTASALFAAAARGAGDVRRRFAIRSPRFDCL